MRRRARGAYLLVASAIALLGTSCAASRSNVLVGATEARRPSATPVSDRVIIGSRALARKLAYGEVVARREGLILHVQVALENLARGPVAFEYRWEWLDAAGFQLGDTLSRWHPAFVNGNERKLLSGVGPGPAAVNFRLHVRSPQG